MQRYVKTIKSLMTRLSPARIPILEEGKILRNIQGFTTTWRPGNVRGFMTMVSQDRSVSWGLAGPSGHPKERSPHRAFNPKRRTTSREARSPTPWSTGRWEEDVQKGLDTMEEVSAMAATAASGSEKTPRTRRQVKLLTWSQPREPATRLPSPTTPKRSQGPMGWMPPPPPLLPARSSPESTTPLQQLFAYLCDTPEEWPQVQKDMVWWRRIFRDK